MTRKSHDKQHDAYRKKKAAQYKEPRALTEDELAEALFGGGGDGHGSTMGL